MTDEIIEKIMQGDSKSEDYEMLKRMFPEFFEVVTKDIEKAINLQQEQTNQNIKKFIEELEYKISQSCYIENQGVNDLFDDIKELTSKYFPQITNHNSLTNPELDSVSRIDENKTSERNKSSEGSNTVEQTEMTGSVSEVNNQFEDFDEGGESGWCEEDCQSKQEKE